MKFMLDKNKTMFAMKVAALACAATMSVAARASGDRSNRTFVFLRPETSSFWHTATNSTMSVPVDFPKGASSATLRVSALGYAKEYEISEACDFRLELPKPDAPGEENVYDLTLSFNDGTVRTAKLGLIQGLADGAKGAARCLLSDGSRAWQKVRNRAVLPIPCGVDPVYIGGNAVETGLGGAQGWYALRLCGGEKTTLAFEENAQDDVGLFGAYDGVTIKAR